MGHWCRVSGPGFDGSIVVPIIAEHRSRLLLSRMELSTVSFNGMGSVCAVALREKARSSPVIWPKGFAMSLLSRSACVCGEEGRCNSRKLVGFSKLPASRRAQLEDRLLRIRTG